MAGRKRTEEPEKPQEYVRHKSRPLWGVGVLVSDSGEMKTYLFADGQKRAFKAGLIADLVEPAEAPKEEDRERLSRGLNAGGSATPKAINLELEKQILANPDDPAPYLVYADWLQQREDPRGLLIPIQAALLRDPNSRKLRDAARKLLEEHGAYLLPSSLHSLLRIPTRKDDRAHCQVNWRLGFLESVHLAKRSRQEGDVALVVEELLRHPSAHFLRKLSIGSLGSRNDELNYITSIAAIARAKHPLLRELVIGDFDERVTDLSFSRIGSGSALFSPKAMPALERLTLRGGNVRFSSHLHHPKLKALHVITRDFAKTNLGHVLRGSMPALETLEISSSGLIINNADLVFRHLRKNHPRLRALVLPRTSNTLGLLEGLVRSGISEQLNHLELDGGDLIDTQIPQVAKLKTALASLKKLTLGGPRLSSSGARRVAAMERSDPSP